MKKNYYLLAVLFLSSLLLSACGTNTDIKDNSDGIKEEISADNSVSKTRSSMEEIMKKGKATTCKFVISEDGVTAEGTLYVDGKNMRYGSKGAIEGQQFESNVIVKEGYSYSWTNMDTKGYKMKEIEDTEDESDTEDADIGPEERYQEMDFDCKNGVEKGTFDLPSNIEFMEFNYDNSDI